MTRARLSRRLVLRGAGGLGFALPFLPSLGLAQPAQPKRFIGLYHPNGVDTSWFPTAGATESDFVLQPVHAALMPWRAHLLMTGGLDMTVAVSGPGEQHQRGLGALLTGRKLDSGSFVGNDGSRAGWAMGPSLDQELARLIGVGTRVGSLQLGVNVKERDVSGVLSYAAASQPLLPQTDPGLTFRTLFLDGPPGSAQAIAARRASVLDAVLVQLGSLKKTVSRADAQRLEAHAQRVRELEQRVTVAPGVCGRAPQRPGPVAFDTEAAMPEVAKLHIELVLAAFACDLTRVATFCFSDAKNHIALPFLGIKGDVHNISHLPDGDAERRLLGTRDAWQAQQLAALLGGLQQTPDGNGTLLDSTLVFWGTDVSRGNVHSHDDMPIVLAGHGAGFRMGRYVRWAARPHNDLLLSILKAYGGTATTFGDAEHCTGPLDKLT